MFFTSDAKVIGESLFGTIYLDSVDHVSESYIPSEEKKKVVKVSKKPLVELNKNTKGVKVEENIFDEVKLLKNLDHPNIVKLYHFMKDENHYYTVYEACDGDLLDLLKKDLTYSQKLKLLKDTLEAIRHIHNLGISHFDISLENILYKEENGEFIPKLCDFGLAKVTDGKSLYEVRDMFRNTPGKDAYIDPCIFLVETKLSDLFSFGLCIWAVVFEFATYDKYNETYTYFLNHSLTELLSCYGTQLISVPDGQLPLILDLLERMMSVSNLHKRATAEELLKHKLFTQI